MTTEIIIEFLRKGQLSNFNFCTRQQTIIEALGETNWTIPISETDKRHSLIKYDRVEFYFDYSIDQKLYGVLVTYTKPAKKNKLNVEYGKLKQSISYSDLKSYLHDQNISFEEKQSDFDKTDVIIETEGNVVFYFNDDNTVQKFGRFLKTN